MTTEHQKDIETIYAIKAGDLLGESWEVKPSPDEMSWPDLLVTTKKEEFGLEIREIYLDETNSGSIKKRTEKTRLGIIQQLANDYYKSNSRSIKVHILGDITNHEQILLAITDNALLLSELEKKRIEPYSGCIIHIRRLPDQAGEYKIWEYVSDKVGWVSNVDKKVIDRVIALKAKNLSKYTTNISDVRLLVVSDRIFNSGKARVEDDVISDTHGFKTVYYLSYPESVREFSS